MPTEAFYRQLSTETVYQIYEERGLVDPPLVHEELVEALLAHDVKHFGPPSPLLSLPSELRNRIYEMVFQDDRTYDLGYEDERMQKFWRSTSELNKTHPLLRVNKQTRSDTAGMWYSGRVFKVRVNKRDSGRCYRWFKQIGEENVRCVRRVTFAATLRSQRSKLIDSCPLDFTIDLAADSVAEVVQYSGSSGSLFGVKTFELEAAYFRAALMSKIAKVRAWEAKHGKRLDSKGWRALFTTIRTVIKFFQTDTCWEEFAERSKRAKTTATAGSS
ncbi:hypothetical protein LTR17_014769 [Elasticomyces elasticus]|nr:hypothetical protein LTR17_014769 [Elasticomyces elasticus]